MTSIHLCLCLWHMHQKNTAEKQNIRFVKLHLLWLEGSSTQDMDSLGWLAVKSTLELESTLATGATHIGQRFLDVLGQSYQLIQKHPHCGPTRAGSTSELRGKGNSTSGGCQLTLPTFSVESITWRYLAVLLEHVPSSPVSIAHQWLGNQQIL